MSTPRKISSLTIGGMSSDDLGASIWLQNLAAQVAADPGAVGATAEQAVRIASLLQAFDGALRTASCELTRTAPNIRTKVLARNEAALAVRELVHAVNANPDIPKVQRLNLGLPLRGVKRRRATPFAMTMR